MRAGAAWFFCGVFADMAWQSLAVAVGHEMHAHDLECMAMNVAMMGYWAMMGALVLRRRAQ